MPQKYKSLTNFHKVLNCEKYCYCQIKTIKSMLHDNIINYKKNLKSERCVNYCAYQYS